jgi:sterol desaturase/sphingolipid hydroxylase (fatty acid hydroxylase superfamily)
MNTADPQTVRASNGRTLQWLVRWCAWPAGLAVAATAAWLLSLDSTLAMPLQVVSMVAAVLLIAYAERVAPFRRAWRNGTTAERRIDVTSMAVLMTVADPLIKRGLLPLLASAVWPFVGTAPGVRWFPATWPLPLQIALAALVAEFGQYWMHRAGHTFRWMWAVHGFHHNPTRIYWLNGFRVNPLNMIWHQLAGLGVLVVIGAPPLVVQMLILFGTVIAVFQHANADLRYGGWNRVFATADLHRWHHATGSDSAPANFGALLVVWDQVFGTYRRAAGSPPIVGVDAGAPHATGYVSALTEAARNGFGKAMARSIAAGAPNASSGPGRTR